MAAFIKFSSGVVSALQKFRCIH